jgi:RNA polymerase sigma-70 factor, ECF subfamily
VLSGTIGPRRFFSSDRDNRPKRDHERLGTGKIKMFMERIADGTPAFSAQGEDLELVYRAQEGDTAAFAELVTKYRNRVSAQIYRMILNEEDALEISQKTFIKVWQGIRKFEGRSTFCTWLYMIATHEAIEWLRRNRPLFVELDVDLCSPGQNPDREIKRNEVRQFVLDAVAKLSPKQRALIVLKDLENLQYDEIAEILHCSIGTVMSRLFHARRKLQTLLRPLYERVP